MGTPIALFAYKRAEHTRRALESLVSNHGFRAEDLVVFCDGPRSRSDKRLVEKTREVIHRFGLKGAKIVERDRNQGLSRSIVQGVAQICKSYGRAIVLEDDLEVSPWFLEYMEEGLRRYQVEERVMQVSGHTFVDCDQAGNKAAFLPLTTTWGWATWDRAWRRFDARATGFATLQKNRSLRHQFDLDGAYPYFRLLEEYVAGRADSWGIRWYLTVFLAGGLTLYPGKTLVKNIGLDGSGENCSRFNRARGGAEPSTVPIVDYPDRVAANETLFAEVKRRIRRSRPWWSRWPRGWSSWGKLRIEAR